MGFRLYRHDLALYQAASGTDSSRVPATTGTIIRFYRRGSWANEDVTLADGAGGAVTVRDPGDIVIGDTVQIGTDSSVTRDVTGVTATSITFDTGTGAFDVDVGSRLVVTNSNTASPPPYPRPRTYTDESAGAETATAYQVTVDANGEAFAYTYNKVVDLIIDEGGLATTYTLVADHVGLGGTQVNGPEIWGGLGDDSTNNIAAFDDLITRVGTVESGGIIEIPAGTWRLAGVWTINAITGLTIRGAGREQTTIAINHTGVGIDLTGACSDVTLEGFTIKRLSGTADQIQIASACSRVTIRDIIFEDGGIGVDTQGDDTTVEQCWFEGTGWTSFVRVDGSTATVERCRLNSLVCLPGANWTRGIDIDTGAVNTRIRDLYIDPTGSFSGIGVHVRDDGAGQDPRDTVLIAPMISGGTAGNGIEVDACSGVQVIGGQIEDSLRGVVIDGGTGVKLIGTTIVASQNESIDINGGTHIRIVEVESSDIVTAGADHINIAAETDDISIQGFTAGNFIRGTGGTAGAVVNIIAGTSDRVQVMGVRGVAGSFNNWILNNSDSQEMDFSHNLVSGATVSISHTAPLATDADIQGASAVLGVYVETGTATSIPVQNVHTVELDQSGATSLANLTAGQDGQEVTLIAKAVNTTIVETGNIRLATGASSWAMDTIGDLIKLRYSIGVGPATWWEVSRTDQ